MRRIFIILSIVSVLPFAANAQLSKLMSKYHEKNGVTVTQLDKSLYGLYQRNNLPPEANELLQKLEEVNILNLDLNQTDPFYRQFQIRIKIIIRHFSCKHILKSSRYGPVPHKITIHVPLPANVFRLPLYIRKLVAQLLE